MAATTTIASWTAQLAALQTEENELASALSAKRSEVADLKRKIATATNANAPISSLPVETLAAIFEIAVYIPPDNYFWCKPSVEIAISHVSSHWRRLALSRPSLWTDIAVGFPNPSPWCQLYIARSQQLLVTLVVHMGVFEYDLSLDPKSQFVLLDALIPRMHRMKLRSYDYSSHLVPLYDYWRQVSPPALKYLHLEIDEPRDINTQTENALFDHTPALRTLHLACFGITTCSVPASTITHLFLSRSPLINYSEFRDALQRFVSLTHLTMLDDHVFDWAIDDDVNRSYLPALTHLRMQSIRQSPDGLVAGFLNVLHAPSLTHLDLDAIEEELAPFLDNNHSPNYHSVRTLGFSGFSAFTMKPMMVLLSRKFPAVTSLDLGPMRGTTLRNLARARTNQGVPIWDHLDTLAVRWEEVRVGSEGVEKFARVLQGLLSTRRQAGHPICKVRISGDITGSQLTATRDIWDPIRAQGCEVEEIGNNAFEDPFNLDNWPQ